MTESEFLRQTDLLFARIAAQIDDSGADLDSEIQGNVLTVENGSGGQIVINRHAAKQEIWLADKSGGYHFACRNGRWHSARDDAGFTALLQQCLERLAGEPVPLADLDG